MEQSAKQEKTATLTLTASEIYLLEAHLAKSAASSGSHTLLSRLRQKLADLKPALPKKNPKKLSRNERWANAAKEASTALQDLVDLQSEYEDWKNNLPENLQSSALGEMREAFYDLDLVSAQGTAEEAMAVDLPQGFGRD